MASFRLLAAPQHQFHRRFAVKDMEKRAILLFRELNPGHPTTILKHFDSLKRKENS
jgi:hypothetical protein